MKIETRSELHHRLLRDTLFVGFCLWSGLYVADLVKPGFASNYVSLPGAALVLFVVAVLTAMTTPQRAYTQEKTPTPAVSWGFAALVFMVVAASLRFAGLSWWLTLALAFVTFLSFYALQYGADE